MKHASPHTWPRLAAGLCVCAGCAILLVLAAASVRAAGPEGGLDGRGWELASPVDKNGGEVALPGGESGAFQAAAGGGAVAFASAASFGQAAGAAPFSQYVATRGAAGWGTTNVTPPLLSGTYEGGAYQLFSSDLTRAILSNGWRCRGGQAECAAENPPLGPGAPAGYRNLYLREGGDYTPLITSGAAPTLGVEAEDFELSLLAASPDLRQIRIEAAGHTYEWSEATLTEVNPPDWEAEFDPGAEVQGVLGASSGLSYVYYLNASGLWLWHGGTNTKVAAGADASNYPAATGTARVTPDGSRLAFLSSASLTGYPNAGKAEVYLYEAPSKQLLCASCNPKGTAPKGPSTIPGARAAGGGPALYKPRSLSADGTRLFFDSADVLVSTDTDFAADVYEWEANGTGSCAKAAGCLGLISGGRVGSSSFIDASADGTDAYFLTTASLLPADTGSRDVYDARVGGGYPEPPPPIPCFGDACQGPPPGPDDPTPATDLVVGRGNAHHHPSCRKKRSRKRDCHGRRKRVHHTHRGARR